MSVAPLLYGYFRSSAAYRLRIAFNLKGVAYDLKPVHLVRDGGEHRAPAFLAVNPQGRVPALAVAGEVLTQSPAILEWLEETHPEPPLLPASPIDRAKVRAVTNIICCDIHPMQNPSTQNWLRRELRATPEQVSAWLAHWMQEGLAAVEALVRPGPFAFGPAPGLADVCIVPQIFSARRFGVPLAAFPKIAGIVETCEAMPAFQAAAPGLQPDAE